jgi:carbon-monoxide dehydrogenase large subunit
MVEARQFSVVGKRIPRLDARDKVTGCASYGVDVQLPGMLWGKMLRSPYPHARIIRIDASNAKAMRGVRAVITGKDVPEHKIGFAVKDQDILPRDRVRYVGEPIALVAAIDEETAAKAVDAIALEVEELPAVYEIEEALKEGAPLVHDDPIAYDLGPIRVVAPIHPVPCSNICSHMAFEKGDVDRAFREAAYLFEDTFVTHPVHPAHLEPHVAVASASPSGDLTVWTNTQRVFGSRAYLSEVLGLPLSRIRVIGTDVGGGFGGLVRPFFERFPALLALKTQKPVKMVMTRNEEFTTAYRSVPGIISIKTGLDKEGRILGRATTAKWDTGASAQGIPPMISALTCGDGPYRIDNVKIEVSLVYTNRVPGTSFRGVGMPDLVFAVESHMDIIARKIGMDPIDLRVKNLIGEGSETLIGTTLTAVGLLECVEKVKDALEWGKSTPSRGKGIACFKKFPDPVSSSSAHVLINEDGTVALSTGASEIGQGSKTVLAQICAEELGVGIETLRVVMADTASTPFDHGAFSSRLTYHAGNAVRMAAADAKKQILKLAAIRLEVPEADLDLKGGFVHAKNAPEHRIALSQLARELQATPPGPVQGIGSYAGGMSPAQLGSTGGKEAKEDGGWKYGATGVELEVDKETGDIKVIRVVSAHDCGRAVNPTMVEGQIEGGVVMAFSNFLFEEMQFDQGRNVNPSFMDYLIPTAADCPEVTPVIVEKPAPDGPFGAKGVGELGILGVGGAIANALDNLTGVRIRNTPITPEKVLKALEENEHNH